MDNINTGNNQGTPAQQGNNTEGGAQGEERLFTQEEVNNLINKRFGELMSKVEDYDALKEKTYCCNSFVMAALVHGMGLFKKCKGGSTHASYWPSLKRNGKPLFKIIGSNVKYSQLKPGDLLCKKTHVKMFTGKSKIKGLYLVSHAAGEGWGKRSIRTDRVKGRIGKEYTAVRYIG